MKTFKEFITEVWGITQPDNSAKPLVPQPKKIVIPRVAPHLDNTTDTIKQHEKDARARDVKKNSRDAEHERTLAQAKRAAKKE